MREIVFDLETTGIDPQGGHRIVEIGCVELIDKKMTGRFFHHYVNPEREVPKSAEKIHGLSTEFLKDKPLFKTLASGFLEFIAGDKLVIHNAAFDMGFINYQLQELSKPSIDFKRAIDTLDIARKKFPGAKATLDALCTRYNICLQRREKHGALLDAELLAEVYIQMMGGYQNSFNLATNDKKLMPIQTKRRVTPFNRPIRHFPPTPEEIALHTEFMRNISKS
jgi:DNA polymerase-3 subunit epsilon